MLTNLHACEITLAFKLCRERCLHSGRDPAFCFIGSKRYKLSSERPHDPDKCLWLVNLQYSLCLTVQRLSKLKTVQASSSTRLPFLETIVERE